MAYLSLYRKYRSENFEDIVGQQQIVQILTNALKQNRLAHAYIFAGPRGTGKTSLARILAKAINCREGLSATPCLKCDLCLSIKNGTAIDVLEIDAASNRGIEEIRQIREQVNFTPAEGRYKIYIIDEVHMLTTEAFNALLKTLEEPPSFTLFILATTEIQKIPATIISRCQRLDFRRISAPEIAARLKYIAEQEKISIEDKSIQYLSRVADGGLRDAISLLDQAMAYKGAKINFEDILELVGSADFSLMANLLEVLGTGKIENILAEIEKIFNLGKNLLQLCRDLLNYLRNMLLVKIGAESTLELSSDHMATLKKQSEKYSVNELRQALTQLSKTENEMRWQANNRLLLELALIELFHKTDAQIPTSTLMPTPVVKVTIKPEAKTEAIIEESPEIKGENKNELKREMKTEVKSISASSNLGLIDVKNEWQGLLDKVRLIKPALNILLCECEPIFFNGEKLVLQFKDNFSFHRDRLLQDKHRQIVENILLEIYKHKVSLEAIIESENTQKTNDQPPVSKNTVKTVENRTTPHVEKLMNIFNGKVKI